MAYTIQVRDDMLARAGTSLDWSSDRGGHRPTGARGFRGALRADLAARQGGLCAQCGDALDGNAVFAHLVARGPAKRGWHAGNIAITHSECNDCRVEDARMCPASSPCHFHIGPVIQPSDMARADIVAVEWPHFPTLKASL